MRRAPRFSKAPAPPSDDSSDSEDVFGSRKKTEEDAQIAARRARLAASAIARKPADNSSQAPVRNGPKITPDVPRRTDTDDKRPRKRARSASAVFDMFERGAAVPAPDGGAAAGAGADAPVESGGYARVRAGETLRDGRYVVGGELGRGVFASVVRATEAATGVQVAIKLSRANAAMRRAAQRELATLRHVHEFAAGTDGTASSVVQVRDDFVHRDAHVAIVFELLHCSLHDVVRQFSSGVRLAFVRLYAAQLLRALVLLARADVVHADLKPDNILLGADRTTLRLADFGCAMRREHRTADERNQYLAARFYRAPETILGFPPAAPIDVWSAACVLYELYTGSVAFAGANNNEMIALILDARGPFPARLLRRARLRSSHFDTDGRFLKKEKDAITGEDSVRVVPRPLVPKVSCIREAILTAAASDDDRGSAPQFADLVEAMLAIDPAKRITPNEALRMPFFHTDSKAKAGKKSPTK